VIALPPLLLGAVHDTVTCVLPPTPLTAVGAPGVVRGVTVSAVDVAAGPSPATLVATTEKVYAVPLTRPPTVHDVESVVWQVAPPGSAVTL
jgi:hypothetical protein